MNAAGRSQMNNEGIERRRRLLHLANTRMRDARSVATSKLSKPTVAFDAGYFALLSALPAQLLRGTQNHPCPELAAAAASKLALDEIDARLAEGLARTRTHPVDWVESTVFDWARRVIAAGHRAAK